MGIPGFFNFIKKYNTQNQQQQRNQQQHNQHNIITNKLPNSTNQLLDSIQAQLKLKSLLILLFLR